MHAVNHETPPQPTSPIEIIRVVILLTILATFALWGFTAWDSPLSFVFGIGAPVVALLMWALFLSTKPVMVLHPLVRAVVELLLYAATTAVWWTMGETWIGLGFGLVAVAVGLVYGRRTLSRSV